MAPEQADGLPVDGRADLFSVGVVLYRMLAGKSPFQRDTMTATLKALAMHAPAPAATLAADLPAAAAGLIDRMIAKEPAGRPATAKAALAEVERALREAVAAKPAGPSPVAVPTPSATDVVAAPAAPAEPAARSVAPQSKRKLWLGLGGVLAVALVVVVVIKITNSDGSVTKIEVPDGAKVEVEKDGKTVAVVGPDNPAAKPFPFELTPEPLSKVEPARRWRRTLWCNGRPRCRDCGAGRWIPLCRGRDTKGSPTARTAAGWPALGETAAFDCSTRKLARRGASSRRGRAC